MGRGEGRGGGRPSPALASSSGKLQTKRSMWAMVYAARACSCTFSDVVSQGRTIWSGETRGLQCAPPHHGEVATRPPRRAGKSVPLLPLPDSGASVTHAKGARLPE